MVGSRGFLSLYESSTHSRAERLPSRYSHALSRTVQRIPYKRDDREIDPVIPHNCYFRLVGR